MVLNKFMKRNAFGTFDNVEHSDEEPIVKEKDDPERGIKDTIKYLNVRGTPYHGELSYSRSSRSKERKRSSRNLSNTAGRNSGA